MRNNYKIDSIISEAINKECAKIEIKNGIKNQIEEELLREYKHKKGKKSKSKKLGTKSKGSKAKRNEVMHSLRTDDTLNHAQIAYSIWKPTNQAEKDQYRSTFSQMVKEKPDKNGIVRHFSDSDINKIYQLLNK